MERNTQVSARTGSDFVSIPKVSLPNSDEDYHYKHFFFHREQRIKKLEARNAIYRPKGPHEDGRHLLEYVLAKLRTCRPERGPDPMGSLVMSLRNEQVVKIVFCFVFRQI